MRHKVWLVVPFCAAAFVAVGVGPANAQGQVERGPEHANSICSFSGLNDTPDDPVEGGRVQSYGQLVRAGLKDLIPTPSDLCNGHTHPYPEAFEGGE